MQVLGHAAIGIAVLDRDGRILQGNARLAQIAARSLGELQSLGWAGVAHPDDWSWQQALVAEVAAGRRSELELEQRLLRPDGTIAFLSVTLSPLPDASDARAVAVVQDVTSRRLGEEALRGSELRFRRLIEKLPAAAYTCDTGGLITFYNEQAVALWGRAPRLNHRDDRYCGSFKLLTRDGTPMPHERCCMARALQEGRDFDGEEIQIERPDGSRVFALAHASPLRDDAGNLIGCVNILIDISDRKHAEEQLRSSEQRFEKFMQHLPGLAWIKDLDGRYLYVNDAAERAFQRTRDQLYGLRDDALFPEDTSAAFRENDQKALVAGRGIETIETLEHADGPHHSIVAKFPIPGPAGETRLIGGVAIDITDRIAAESALRETEARFRDMADHAPVLIWVNGTQGCEFVNREYLRFLGCTLEEVRGDGWRRFIHPEDTEDYGAEYQRSVAAQRPFEALMRFRRADGEYRLFRSTGVPRRSADGSLVGYVGCSVDVTEIKQSEQALKDADRRKDEFLATLAHELRNPLAPIRSSLELLRGSTSPAPEIYQLLGRQVDQLVRLVDDLLDVSRITRGHIALRRARVLLADVIGAAVETAKPALDAAHHRLELSLPPEPVWLDGDPLRLSQVFVNLLNNAAKYTQEGGRVEISAQRRGAAVEISVRDDGIGIAADVLSRVFDPFTQIDRSSGRAQGGLGIGLALAAQLTALHGGRVEAHSDGPGRGSEFRVSLPLAEAPIAKVHAAREPQPARRPPVVAGPVLVVDDNRDGAESLALLLRTRGVPAEVAFDGPSALEKLAQLRPSIVLLDLGMPGMDGFEVARRMRAEAGAHGALLVALTGWNQPEIREQVARAGFDRHLVKPVQVETLEALLALQPGAAAS
jgi:PAS domain S-box-containing protein